MLRMECSPQISAHDLIMLCGLREHAFCYNKKSPPPAKDPDNPLLWRQLGEGGSSQGKKKVIILDIRSREEYPINDVIMTSYM